MDLLPREERVIAASEILSTMIPNLLKKSLATQEALYGMAKAQLIGLERVPERITKGMHMAEEQIQEYRNAISLYETMMGFSSGEKPSGHSKA